MTNVGFSQDNALPLMVDIQYMEPYASSAFNRKFKNILLAGFYSGFIPKPGNGLNLLITSAVSEGGLGAGAASIDTNGYQVTVQQNADVTMLLTAGKSVIIALQADYQFGVVTNQVKAESTVKASQIITLDINTELASNQIELCRVVIPAGTTQITAPMISTKYRVDRLIGITLSDRIDLADSNTGASSMAVKTAVETAEKYADDNKAAKGINNDITELNAVTSLGAHPITVAAKISLNSGLGALGESHFSLANYVDPYEGTAFAIKATGGIAISGTSYFIDALNVEGALSAGKGVAVTGGLTADTAKITGQIIGAMPSRELPANTNATWFKIANIKNAGGEAGWLNLLISGGDYGSPVIGTDILSLSGRGLPATGTPFTAAVAAQYVQHIQVITAGMGAPTIGVVANIDAGVYTSLDFYIKSPSFWEGAKVSITGGAGYTYYGDNPTTSTNEPSNIFYITPSAVLTSLSSSYNLAQASMNLKSLTLTNALSVANGGTGATTPEGARANLELGSAAIVDVGTTGAVVPLLSTANEFDQQQAFSGGLTSAGEVISTKPNSFRSVVSGRGALWQNDGNYLYLLTATESGGFGNWTDIRPFTVSLSSGQVNMSNGQVLSGNTEINGTLTLQNALTVANGGTGATTAAAARDNLGLGSAALMTTSPGSYDILAGITTEAASTTQLVQLRDAAALTGKVNTFSQQQVFTGGLTAAQEIISTSQNSFRIVTGGIGTFWRNDGGTLYLFTATDSGGLGSSWTSLRPFQVLLSTGQVTMSNGQTLSGGTTINQTLTLQNALTVANGGTGATTAKDARTNLGLGSAALMSTSSAAFDGLTGNTTEAASTTQLVGLRDAAALTGKANKFSGVQRFENGVEISGGTAEETGGTNWNCGIFGGLGDGAVYDQHNLQIRSWWGLGFYDTSNKITNIVFDLRTGNMSTKGKFTAETLAINSDASVGGSLTLTEALTVANGGTGATTATDARKNLGLGSAALMTTSSAAFDGLSGSVSEAASTAQLAGLREAAALTSQVNTFPEAQKFTQGIGVSDGVNFGMFTGNGDGASYAQYGLQISSWWGVGFYDSFNKATNIIFDLRTGNMSTKGNLSVDSGITTSTLNATGAVSIGSSLTVQKAAVFADSATFSSAVNISAGIELTGATPYIDFHYQSSSTDYSARLICDSATQLSVYGDFKVTGATNLNGVLNANAGTTTTTLNATSSVSVGKTLTVSGTAAFSSDATVSGSLYVTGYSYFTNSLRASSFIDIGQQNSAAGTRSITFYPMGDSSVQTGQISVTGHTMSLTSDNLTLAGAVTITSSLLVSGASNINTLGVSGTASFGGAVNANSGMTTTSLNVTGALSVGSSLTVTGAAVFSKSINVGESLTTSGNITSTGGTINAPYIVSSGSIKANNFIADAGITTASMTNNGNEYVNGQDFITKRGSYAPTSTTYQTNGFRTWGRADNFYVDWYHYESVGNYTSQSLHVSATNSAYYEFRETAQLVISGANPSLLLGSTTYQGDGNINGGAWGGYLSNYLASTYLQIGNLAGTLGSYSAGSVGSYALLRDMQSRYLNPGDVVAGSTLNYSSAGEYYGTAPAGTWRCMGHTNNKGGYDGDEVTLFLRVN